MKKLMWLSLLLLGIGEAMAGNDSRHKGAEKLMIEAQARAYSAGLHCECTPDDFLDRVSPAEEAGQKYTDED